MSTLPNVLTAFLYPLFRMALSRRLERFSARDVMEMVVNGESDVDIAITETDEESGEEEDYGMESNENQTPSVVSPVYIVIRFL